MRESLINSSFKYCEHITKEHYENFPVASFLIPKEKRKYIYAIYAFARAADDFADEPGIRSAEDRLNLLNDWGNKLKDCYEGKAYDPIFIALKETVNDCSIRVETFEALLKAFKQDVIKNRYANFDEVLFYCNNSADPIGRMILMVLGGRDEKMFFYSDKICTALQLTNFWQDLEIDLNRNRIYIPLDDMNRFGYSEKDLLEKTINKNFTGLMKFEVDRTRSLFHEGKEIYELVRTNDNLKRFAKELKLIILGGLHILNKIENLNYNVFYKRPVLTTVDKIRLVSKSLFGDARKL
jgi:squalene synthase HpnC